jgi:hypothetical protein
MTIVELTNQWLTTVNEHGYERTIRPQISDAWDSPAKGQYRGAQVFRISRNYRNILDARLMIRNKFDTERPQTLGAIVQNVLIQTTWRPRFVYPGWMTCFWDSLFISVDWTWGFIWCYQNPQLVPVPSPMNPRDILTLRFVSAFLSPISNDWQKCVSKIKGGGVVSATRPGGLFGGFRSSDSVRKRSVVTEVCLGLPEPLDVYCEIITKN